LGLDLNNSMNLPAVPLEFWRLKKNPLFSPAMSIWTRVIEVLGEFGGSVSDFLSRLARSGREPPAPERSIAFTIGMIALGAKMAKADGVVTADEIAAFKRIFHVPRGELQNLAKVFNYAKRDVAGYESYARQIARLFAGRPQILEDVMDGLFHIATADGRFHQHELDYLERIAQIFGFGEREFTRIRARHLRPPKDDPYVILGIEQGLSDRELKQRYRALVRANHPDRHIAAGVPPELIDIATRRLAAINSAYSAITKARGL
jgi:DnaJ like chaperone protein